MRIVFALILIVASSLVMANKEEGQHFNCISGYVLLSFSLVSGYAKDIKIEKSEPKGLFDLAAIEGIKKMSFKQMKLPQIPRYSYGFEFEPNLGGDCEK